MSEATAQGTRQGPPDGAALHKEVSDDESSVKETAAKAKAAAVGTAADVRRKRPALDHLIRAFGRYSGDGGARLAASVALPAFLSIFPLLALAFFVLGFVVSGSESIQRSILDGAQSYLPGLLCSGVVPSHGCPAQGGIDINSIANARTAAGVIGVVGLVFAGTGMVDALRNAIRLMWRYPTSGTGNIVVRKLRDAGTLAGLGVGALVSVTVSGVANSATDSVLNVVGVHGGIANLVVKLIGYGVSIGVNVVLFAYLYAGLAQVEQSTFRLVWRGALFAAVGLLVLQIVGAIYLRHTTGNPIYGIFATIVGLLIWLNLIFQFTLFSAAWTVTAPFDSDIAPSATAAAATVGAATVLAVPVPASLYADDGVGPAARPEADEPRALTAAQPRRVESAVRTGAGVSIGLAAAGTAVVLVYAGRTIADVIRSSGD